MVAEEVFLNDKNYIPITEVKKGNFQGTLQKLSGAGAGIKIFSSTTLYLQHKMKIALGLFVRRESGLSF